MNHYYITMRFTFNLLLPSIQPARRKAGARTPKVQQSASVGVQFRRSGDFFRIWMERLVNHIHSLCKIRVLLPNKAATNGKIGEH